MPNVIEDDGRAISTPSATEVPVELRPTSENELNLGTTFEGADRRASSTRREHGSPSNSVLQPTPFASAAAQSSPEAATALLSGLLGDGAGRRSHTGDAQPEHATGGWGVVIHPPTTLVSRAGQVCVPFKI